MEVHLSKKRRAVGVQVTAAEAAARQVVAPGDVIAAEAGYLRGHGTHVDDEGHLIATVAGVVERVNKLVCVKPLRTRFVGEIGDVVIGRITEVGQRKWKVDTNSRLDSILLLSSVNLPGGALRRRSAEDELGMRDFLVEGDVISAEVQSLNNDGSLSLHTRSSKYGKLERGVFLEVPSAVVRRCKNHFHILPCGVRIVLGNNGYIWIGEPVPDPTAADKPAPAPMEPREMRIRVARVRNIIQALASQGLQVFDTSIIYSYDDSEGYDVKDLIKPDVARLVTERASHLLVAQ